MAKHLLRILMVLLLCGLAFGDVCQRHRIALNVPDWILTAKVQVVEEREPAVLPTRA